MSDELTKRLLEVGDLYTDKLEEAVETAKERHATYGHSWIRFGMIMAAYFPDGLTLKGADDFSRFDKFCHVVGKMSRYAHSLPDGGHADSARDAINYAAMLETFTEEQKDMIDSEKCCDDCEHLDVSTCELPCSACSNNINNDDFSELKWEPRR